MPCSNKSDISFGGQQCDCRPELEQSCSSCTKKHSCVWVEDSSIEVTTTYSAEGGDIVTTFSLNTGSSCWAGDLFAGPTYDDWELDGEHITVHAHLHGSDWKWGQCNISGVWMVIIIFFSVFVILMMVAFAFKMVMDRRRLRLEVKARSEPLLLVAEPAGAG